MRDTDADWREIGAAFPYWGVLTAPEYRQAEVPPDILETFYASGRSHIGAVAERLARIVGGPVRVDRALDFGCGVGRLTEAMTAYAESVIGLDVSPGMLEQARRNSGGGPTYVETMPDGPFDWINSYIVFQHIPPQRGMALLEQLLGRLSPGGLVSLHMTIYRDGHLPASPAPPPAPRAGLLSRWRMPETAKAADAPVGEMMMYDYDLGDILAALHRHGVEEASLVHSDHGGHHGEMIFGRRI